MYMYVIHICRHTIFPIHQFPQRFIEESVNTKKTFYVSCSQANLL